MEPLHKRSREFISVVGVSSSNFPPNCKQESRLALALGRAQELVWVCFCAAMKDGLAVGGLEGPGRWGSSAPLGLICFFLN